MLFAVVLTFVIRGSNSPQTTSNKALISNEASAVAANPLDQLSSADVAVHIARTVQLYETPAVTNRADSVNAQLAITPANESVVAKPQIITTALRSKRDIKIYTTVAGDSVESLASKFGVTSDTIRWSNNVTGSALAAGRELIISPVNGIVVMVKAGDTPDILAERYRANKDQIIVFNDAELNGLTVGERIVIPDGTPPVAAARSLPRPSAGFAWGGDRAVYSGNGYDYGYCTWWSAVRRAQVGKPIPSNLGNASTWKVLAQRAGFEVGNVPRTHAVIWTPPRDYYGHVAFVESVDADGTVHISEMNVAGWNRTSTKTLSPEQASSYGYIY